MGLDAFFCWGDIINDIEKFRQYLYNRTVLSAGTIRNYVKIVRAFLKDDWKSKVNIEELNDFITYYYREKRMSWVKYAFKYYFRFIKKEKMYKKLVQVRTLPRKRHGVYLDRNVILNFINHIQNPIHRTMAMLQFLTGARSREIISLKKSNIALNYDGKKNIKLILLGKGSKTRPVFLSKEYADLLKQHDIEGREYLFLPITFNHTKYGGEDWERKIRNQYKYYYDSFKKARQETGQKLNTHDLRRNVTQHLLNKKIPLNVVKNIMGHARYETTLSYSMENPPEVKEVLLNFQNEKKLQRKEGKESY